MIKKRRNKAKSLISLALYSLMLKKDYESITVKEICEKAGVSRMSFYRFYNKKDDIFIEYCDERFEEFYSSISERNDLSIKEFTLEMFRFIKKYLRQIKILKMANREWMLLDQLNSYAKYTIANLKTNNYMQEQKNNPIFAYFMAGGLFNVLMDWVDQDGKTTPEEMNAMLYSIAGKMN